MKTKEIRKNIVRITRNIFGTLTILNFLCILVYTMAPREIAIKVIEKSFYPPFIGYYATQYKEAKNNNQDKRDTYNKMIEELNELKITQKKLNEEDKKAFELFLKNTCDETLKKTNEARDRQRISEFKVIEKRSKIEEYKLLYLNEYREKVNNTKDKLLDVFLINMFIINVIWVICWIITAITKTNIYNE